MLSDKQHEAITLLAEGNKPITHIAEALQVDRGTIYRWLKKKEFKDKLDEMNELRDQYLRQTLKDDTEEFIKRINEISKLSKNDIAKLRATENLLRYAGWDNEEESNVKEEDETKNKLKEMLFNKKKK